MNDLIKNIESIIVAYKLNSGNNKKFKIIKPIDVCSENKISLLLHNRHYDSIIFTIKIIVGGYLITYYTENGNVTKFCNTDDLNKNIMKILEGI